MFKKIFYILIILAVNITIGYSQPKYKLTTKSKKAERAYFKAIEYIKVRSYLNAEHVIQKALKADPNFIEAYMLLGDVYSDTKKTSKSIECFQKAIDINPGFFPRNYYIIASKEVSIGRYTEAKDHYLNYLNSGAVNENLRERIEKDLETCNFSITAIDNPVPYNPINLGNKVNSKEEEHSPTITADEQTLIFTVKRPRDEYTQCQGCKFEEDFYMSKKVDGEWTKAFKLGPPLNTNYNEGVQCISPDGKYIFFTRCNRPEGFGSCDLYYSKLTGSHWSEPENLGASVNSKKWDTQPSITSDGKTLYFASARKGGKGNVDIWKTTLRPDGKWGKPENLGDAINTKRAEMAPFIHPDNHTLYFISNGHPGMGGMDIFYTRKDSNGVWQKPVNIGYPINTFADERSLIVNANGNVAFFSSNLPGGYGKYDLYYFDLYEEARPQKVTYMKGIVYDKNSKKRMEAKFELIDLATGNLVIESRSDAVNGEFLVSLPTNKNYALNVSKKGYLFYSDNFSLSGEYSNIDPFLKDVPLTPINIDEIIILKNIFFETNQFSLKNESVIELNKLYSLLNNNPKMKIEIRGHTDNVGSKEYNEILSLYRSKAVYNYLVLHSISAERLTYKGFGFSEPIDTNNTPEGKANNRRTEFRVISK